MTFQLLQKHKSDAKQRHSSILNPLILVAFLLVFGFNNAISQTTLFLRGTTTWNGTNNWSTTSGGTQNTTWTNGNTATLETSPVITFTGTINPRIFGLNCTSTGSLTGNTIYLSGSTAPSIDVSSSQTLTINSILAGGLGFTKTGAGTLTLGANNNKYLSAAGITISGGIIDFTNFVASTTTPVTTGLRLMPVALGGNTLQYGGATAADMRLGGVSGSGTLSAGSTNTLNIFNIGTNSTSATISGTGINLRGTNSANQTFTNSISGVTGTYGINGVSLYAADGTNTNSLTVNGSSANSNNFSNSTNVLALRGGSLIIDNTTNNNTSRFYTSTAVANLVTCLGGTLNIKGNAAGTTLNLGSGSLTSNTALQINGGLTNIILDLPSSPSGATVLNVNISTSAPIRANVWGTVNFVGRINGVITNLGQAGSNPRITFTNTPQSFTTTSSNLLNNGSASSATYGWATVNYTDWAAQGSNGITAAAYDVNSGTYSNLQSAVAANVVLFTPGASGSFSGSSTLAAALTLAPSAGSLTLSLAGFNLPVSALMLRGTTDFTISNTGTGTTGLMSASNTRYIWVMQPSTTLSLTGPIRVSGNNALIKSGEGILALTGSVNQIPFTASTFIRISGGVLRGNVTAFGGGTTSDGDFTRVGIIGGILEIDGGGSASTFGRALLTSFATTNGGTIYFDNGSTERGNGGFSAINGNSTVTLFTTIGGSTPSTCTWNSGGFISNGYSLLFGSTKYDSRITLANALALDDGTATNNYFAREVYVYDNSGSSSDEAELSGVISGGLNADLLKGGPGVLRLSNTANTYSGNTIVAQGTLNAVGAGSLPSGTSVQIMNGATLINSAINTITDLVLESGSTLSLGSSTLRITGDFVNNGGTITGTGTIEFNGTTQQYVNGSNVTFSGAVTVNNTLGLNTVSNTSIMGTLNLNADGANIGIPANRTFSYGKITNSSASRYLSPATSSNIATTGVPTPGGTVYFDPSNNSINNLTLGDAGTTVLGNTLKVNGTLDAQNGSNLNTGSNLTLSSTGRVDDISFTSDGGGSIEGILNVEIAIPGGRRAFRLLSHPFAVNIKLNSLMDDIHITGATGATAGFDETTTNNPSAFSFSESGYNTTINSGWNAFTNASAGVSGNDINTNSPIRILYRGPRSQSNLLDGTNPSPNAATLDWAEYPNQGTQSIALSYTAGIGGGFNLLPNPYPSNYDLGSTVSGNRNDIGTFAMWVPTNGTRGGYSSASFGSSFVIASGDAFFVQTGSTGLFNYSESLKTGSAPSSFSKTNPHNMNALQINVYSDSIYWDKLEIRNRDFGTVNRDQQDAPKMQNPDVNFFAMTPSNEKLAIDNRNIQNGNVIPLGFEVSSDYNFSFKVSNFDLGQFDVQLVDKYLNKTTPLALNTEYKFTTNADAASKGSNRFELVFNKTTGIQETVVNHFNLYPNPATETIHLSLLTNQNGNFQFEIYNQIGAMVKSGKLDFSNNRNQSIGVDEFSNGVYFVKVFNASANQTIKFIK